MSKKTDKSKLDELDLDNFDFGGDFDSFEPAKIKNDRNPITEVKSAAATSIKNTLKDPYFLRRQMEKAMPKGFGDGLRVADDAISSVKMIARDAAKEMKPVVNDLKSTIRKAIPLADKALPKSITDRLKSWSEERKGYSAEDGREAAITGSLSEIFRALAEQNHQQKNETDARENINSQVEANRHRDNHSALEAIRLAVQQQAAYQRSVDANVSRKSLELQYRMMYLQMDQLAEVKRGNTLISDHLAAISHNTGLPDIVKATKAEFAMNIMRNEFVKDISRSFAEKRRNFIRDLGKRISTNVKDKIQGKMMDLQMGLMSANDMLDQFGPDGMAAQMGMTGKDIGYQLAGGMIGDKVVNGVADPLMRRVGKHIGKYETVQKAGRYGSYFAQNHAQMLKSFAQSEKFNGIPGMQMLKDSILASFYGDNVNISKDGFHNIASAGITTNQVNRAIVEVTPGYLSMILRELQINRKGEDTQALRFNYDTGRFDTSTSIQKHLFNKIITSEDRARTKSSSEDFFKLIDHKGTLTDDERKKILGFVGNNNANSKEGSREFYANRDNYYGMDQNVADKFHGLVNNYYGSTNSKYSDKEIAFTKVHNRVGTELTIRKELIQNLANTGHYNDLVQLGVIKDGLIDKSRLMEMLQGQDPAFAELPKKVQEAIVTVADKQQEGPAETKGFSFRRTANIMYAKARNRFSRDKGDRLEIPIAAKRFNGNSNITDASGIIDAIREHSVKEINTNILSEITRLTNAVGEMEINLIRLSMGDYADLKDKLKEKAFNLKDKIKGGLRRGYTAARWGARKAWRGTKAGWGKLKGEAEKYFEVYVGDETKARITAYKLRAGYYVDAITKEPIKTLADIKGDVIDATTGLIVLTKEEFDKMRVMDVLHNRFDRTYDYLKAKGTQAFSFIKGKIPNPIEALRNAKQKLSDYNDSPIDIFVKGELERGPRVRVAGMLAGHYYDQKTGRRISRPGHITGPVIDHSKSPPETVLTEEDFNKGLVDYFGNDIRTKIEKLIGVGAWGLGLAGKGFGKIKEKAGKAWDWISERYEKFKLGGHSLKDLFGWMRIPTLDVAIGTKKIVTTLEQIRDILDGRLPGKKRKIIGDSDGDGVRDGSLEAQAKQKKDGSLKDATSKAIEKLTGALSKGKEAVKDKGMVGSLMGLFGGAKAGIGDALGGAKDLAETYLLSKGLSGGAKAGVTAGEVAGGAAAAGAAAAGASKSSKLKGMAGKGLNIASMLWLLDAFTGMSGKMGISSDTMGNVGTGLMAAQGAKWLASTGAAQGAWNMAKPAAMWAGKNSAKLLLRGLPMLGRLALMGGGAALGAIASVPGMIALGTAAAGAGAYYGYKYYKGGTMNEYERLRFIQYGFLPGDTVNYRRVKELEGYCAEALGVSGGVVSINVKRLDLDALMKKFDVDMDSAGDKHKWFVWFERRFQPFYLGAMNAYYAITKSTDLEKVTDLKIGQKLEFLKEAKNLSGPYNESISPVGGEETLQATKSDAEAAANEIEKPLKEKAGTSNGDTHDTWMGTVKRFVRDQADLASTTWDYWKNEKIGEHGVVGKMLLGFRVLFGDKRKSETSAELAASSKALKDMVGERTTIYGSPVTGIDFSTGVIDPVTAIKLKAYGLRELELDKVRALSELEEALIPTITFAGKGKAVWNGSVLDVLAAHGAKFGISTSDTAASGAFVTWFSKRFLPALLTYAGAINAYTGSQNIKDMVTRIKTEQAIDIATAIVSSPVWDITTSPFVGYALNTDPGSTRVNIDALKALAKAIVLNEKSVPDQGKKDYESASMYDHLMGNSKATKDKGFFDRVGYVATESLGSAASKVSDSIFGKPLTTTEASSYGGTNGTGAGEGVYASLPVVSDDKVGYPEYKQLAESVSKVTGVPLSTIVGIIGHESAWKAKAAAGTSSAKGLSQFIGKTWKAMLAKYGKQYGIPDNVPVTDPRANLLLGALYMRDNAETLKKNLKRPLTETDIYMAHFFGAGGATKFLSLPNDAIAADAMRLSDGNDPVSANIPTFYKGSDKSKPRTVKEIYDMYTNYLRKGQVSAKLLPEQAAIKPSGSKADAPAAAAYTPSAALPMPVAATPSAAGTAAATTNGASGMAIPTAAAASPLPSTSGSNISTLDTPSMPISRDQQKARLTSSMPETLSGATEVLVDIRTILKQQLQVMTSMGTKGGYSQSASNNGGQSGNPSTGSNGSVGQQPEQPTSTAGIKPQQERKAPEPMVQLRKAYPSF